VIESGVEREERIMVQITLTDEQARRVRQALEETVQFCDSTGNVVAEIPPEYNAEFLAEPKRRAASPGPWYTSTQVESRLRALQEEWDRTGGFDMAYTYEFLKGLSEKDPGHLHTTGRSAD
jgi:hypothetical protein